MGKFVLWIVAVMMLALTAIGAQATPSGCWDGTADSNGVRPGWIYNDSVNGTNLVAPGYVCWNTTLYNVPPTATYYCSNNATVNINGTCTRNRRYLGFEGTNATDSGGNENCTFVNSVSRDTVTAAEYYWYNRTQNNTGRYNTALLTQDQDSYPAAPATTWFGCSNDYTVNGTANYCDGAGTFVYWNYTGVTAGKICAPNNGSSQYANSSDNCDTWMNCTVDESSADYVYLGYESDMSGDCNTDYAVDTASDYTAPTGRTFTTTGYAETCAEKGYNYDYTMSDFQPIVVDAMGIAGAGIVQWIEIIVLLIVLGFLGSLVVKIGTRR